ncbi:MAG: hypothetical protein ACRDZY_11610, partial [Acidimicrobiales bacterium]
ALPFGIPDGSIPYRLALVATEPGGIPTLTATVAPSGPTGATPYVDLTVTATVTGSTVGVAGSVTLANLFAGGPQTATFTGSAGPGGALAGTVTFGPIAPAGSPIQPVPGLELQNIDVTLSSASGLTVTAQALLGASGDPITVNLTGTYSAGTWTLTLTSTPVTWTPTGGPALDLNLSGHATLTTAGTVTYDFEASGSPLVSWSPGPGLTFGVDCVALAYGTAPTCGAAALANTPTPAHPTLVVDGSAAVGTANTVTAGLVGTLDLRTGAFALALDPARTPGPIPVPGVPGVTATVTSLAVAGGGGQGLSVTGQAQVSVAALGSTPITLDVSDQAGTLVLAASNIDLSGLGVSFHGFFAYASAAVPGYVTGDPAFGTVDLPAGFTARFDYSPSAGVAAALAGARIGLPHGGTITFDAAWQPGGKPSFSA